MKDVNGLQEEKFLLRLKIISKKYHSTIITGQLQNFPLERRVKYKNGALHPQTKKAKQIFHLITTEKTYLT